MAMSDGSTSRVLSQWVYGGSSVVSLACDIAILVAITTIVRRHRPDAYRALQSWAIGSLVVFLLMAVARAAVPYFAARESIEGYFRASALLTVMGVGLHVLLVVMLIRGLTALAQPPKPITVEGTPPYR